MRRSLSLIVAALAVAACADVAAPPEQLQKAGDLSSITNGQPTGASYGNVGALMFDWFSPKGTLDGNDQWCTGTLIAPRVFLTAAHCVVGIPANTKFFVSFTPDLFSGLTTIPVDSVRRDPRYGHDQANLNDLALVFLPEGSTAGITPANLPALGALDALAAKGRLSKALFVNVGYGVSAASTGRPRFGFDGVRKFSRSEFMALQPNWLGLLMNTAATGEGGDCYGDSGGPKFLDGDASTIYATVVTGDFPCRATSWNWRLDTPAARAFLGQYVTLP